jgi:hypothetical protein
LGTIFAVGQGIDTVQLVRLEEQARPCAGPGFVACVRSVDEEKEKTMKRLVMLACLAVVGCSDSTTSPTPSPTPSGPKTTDTVYTVAMSTANEVPPIANAEAGATGTSTITFHITRDAGGTITAATVDFAVQLANFPPGATARLAHIHTGGSTVVGPVLIDTGLSPSAPVVLTNGTGAFAFSGVSVSAENMAAILANPAGYYFNVHSILNGSGVMRGQLK